MDGWTDGRTDGRTDGWMDGWMNGWIELNFTSWWNNFHIFHKVCYNKAKSQGHSLKFS